MRKLQFPADARTRRRLVCGAAGLAIAAPALHWTRIAATPAAIGPPVGVYCDGCELIHAGRPAAPGWRARIAAPSEPGTPLQLRGTIFQRDGRTPAAGVVLYAYHTDARGHYVPPDHRGAGLTRHGRLRGWIRTGRDGRYRFDTIRPAPYPGRGTPEHVHAVVGEPGRNEYYIDAYEFDDDPLLAAELRHRPRERRGGSGIVHPRRSGSGWLVERDIVLGRNIPHYR